MENGKARWTIRYNYQMANIKIPWAKPNIEKEELNEVIDSFRANWLSMGPKVKKFEDGLSLYLKVPYAVAVSNGTVALDLTLKAIGICPGDEIIVPAMTYFATASMVSYQYAVPVFVDIEKKGFSLNPECIRQAISKKTKALIFIDYGGSPADYKKIADIAKERGIIVVQDGAQSLGAVYDNNPAGAQAEISTMSFHVAKVMTTIEGGMIFTHSRFLRENILMRRNQGEPPGGKYKHVELGTNARMTDLQAAIGLAQLKKLPGFLKERKRVAAQYNQILRNHNGISIPSATPEGAGNAYFFYPILIKDRDRIAHVLLQKYGIDTRVAYPMPVYRQEVYASKKLAYRKLNCPVAEEVTSKILNLPIFPAMSDDEIGYVSDALLKEVIK